MNKSECIKHVVFECALNVLSWNVALLISKFTVTKIDFFNTHVRDINFSRRVMFTANKIFTYGKFLTVKNVDGDSWSQEYCWARGEIH